MPNIIRVPFPFKRIYNSNGRSWRATGDHIQDAIDDLPASGDSAHCGKVWLPVAPSDRPLTIELPITIHGKLWIQGMGLSATSLNLANGVNDSMFKFVEADSYEYCFYMSDFRATGNKGNQTQGHGLEINPTGASDFRDMRIKNVALMLFKENGIYTTKGLFNIYEGLILESNDSRGFYHTGGSYSVIHACKINANGLSGGSITSSSGRVINCEFENNGEHGLGIGASSMMVHGCSFRYNGQKTPNTYDAIHVYGVDDCVMIGNTIRGTSDATAWTRYGVAIDAGSDRTRVGRNTYVGLASGEVLDNGTKTRIEGLGQGAYGIGGTPTAADWSIGDMVRNTDDNTFWVKDYTGTMRKLA